MIGFTSTTFRQLNVDKIIDIAVKAGAECIEWGGDIHVKDVETAKEVKIKCDKVNLTISSYGGYYRVGSNLVENWRKNCEIATALGAKTIRVWLGIKGSNKTTDNEFLNLVSDGKQMAQVASKYGLIIASECHANTYNDTAESTIKFLKAVDKDNFKTYFQSRYRDTECDCNRLIYTLPYVQNVHISYSEKLRMQIFHKKIFLLIISFCFYLLCLMCGILKNRDIG